MRSAVSIKWPSPEEYSRQYLIGHRSPRYRGNGGASIPSRAFGPILSCGSCDSAQYIFPYPAPVYNSLPPFRHYPHPPKISAIILILSLACPRLGAQRAMEVFVSNLPKRQKRRKINAALRNALTEVFGGKAIYEWRQFQKKHVGTITFPTESMGTQFLKRFEHGLAMRQERVKFSISKYSPNPRLVQGLLEKMREMEENGEFDEGIGSSSTSTSASVSFHSIDYGVWASDGTFGRCGTMKRGGILTYNARRRSPARPWPSLGPYGVKREF